MARHAPGFKPGATAGKNEFFKWELHKDNELVAKELTSEVEDEPEDVQAVTPADWQALLQKLSRQYPFTWASRQPAKTSVSALRRSAVQEDEEARRAGFVARPYRPTTRDTADRSATAQDRGHAHHTFLQQVSLAIDGRLRSLETEAQRLCEDGLIKADEIKLLDFKALAAFFSSELGTRIRTVQDFVHRELPFTARFSPLEIARLTGESAPTANADADFVLVQGVADLVVILPEQIWLLDFKTDKVPVKKIQERARLYGPQLQLYSAALAAIYKRPVTESWLYFLDAAQAVSVPAQVPSI
jgi:ATP-dependent helicase/nuclease subunit A